MPKEFDLTDPDTHAGGGADEVFQYLRAKDPIYWHTEKDGPGFWCLTKHDDIVRVSKSPDSFSSSLELGGYHLNDSRSFELNTGVNMITIDPPDHSMLRRAVSPAFAPAKIKDLEPAISNCVTEMMASLGDSYNCDFVESIAAPLPIDVLSKILGARARDKENMIRWSDELIGFDDPEIRNSIVAVRNSLRRMSMFALGLRLKYSKEPDDSIISKLVHSKGVDGKQINMKDFIATFILLIVAGNETTRNAISGGFLALDQHPDQKKRLVENAELVPSAVQEMIRWVSPVIYMRRTATRDSVFRGKTIAAGQKVVMWYGSANRDEDVFEDPYKFDVSRKNCKQLSFGSGTHFCIGSRLAELQMTILFRELITKFPHMRTVGPVVRLRSNFINGIKHLPVSLVAHKMHHIRSDCHPIPIDSKLRPEQFARK